MALFGRGGGGGRGGEGGKEYLIAEQSHELGVCEIMGQKFGRSEKHLRMWASSWASVEGK